MKKNLRRMLCVFLTAGMLLSDAQVLAAYAAEELNEVLQAPEQELMEAPKPVMEQDVAQEEATDSSEHEQDEALPDSQGESVESDTEDGSEGSLREPESYGPKQEEPEGTLVSYDENSCTYDLGNGTYRTVFGVSETFLDEAGEP